MSANALPACVVDTNIWLYAFIEADDVAKSAAARQLLQESQPVVSTQVVNEVCVNLLKRQVFTEGHIRALMDGCALDEFLDNFPTVSREAALKLLSYAASRVVTEAVAA